MPNLTYRALIGVLVIAVTLTITACSSDESTLYSTSSATTFTTAPLPPGIISDAERRDAYAQFISVGRQRTIDAVIKTCGDILLAKLNSGRFPTARSGGRRDDNAPLTGLGLFFSSDKIDGEGEFRNINLTVDYVNGEVAAVRGIEVEYGDVRYILRGWRVARENSRHTDNGVDAYTWEAHYEGTRNAVVLGMPHSLVGSTYLGQISSADDFSVLRIGFNDPNESDRLRAQVSATALQEYDKSFLDSIADICK